MWGEAAANAKGARGGRRSALLIFPAQAGLFNSGAPNIFTDKPHQLMGHFNCLFFLCFSSSFDMLFVSS
jgi:hypothetical protein